MKELLIVFSCVSLVLLTVIGVLTIPYYYGAKRQSEIYNKLNETKYTPMDFFLAGDIIKGFDGEGEKKNLKVRIQK